MGSEMCIRDSYGSLSLILVSTSEYCSKSTYAFHYSVEYQGEQKEKVYVAIRQGFFQIIIGSRNLEPADQDPAVGRTLKSKYYPERSD